MKTEWLLTLIFLCLLVVSLETRGEEAWFVDHQGTIPILITVPHGGRQGEGVLRQRRDEKETDLPSCASGKYKSRGADINSLRLAELFADELIQCTGGAPSLVATHISRKYIDFNRDAFDPVGGAECAFVDPEGLPYWQEYHRRIEQAVADTHERFGECGLLLDVHGFGEKDYRSTLVLGMKTAWGETIPYLRKKVGLDMLYGRGGWVEELKRFGAPLGLNVVPASANGNYHGLPNGGYTVRRYSTAYRNDIDDGEEAQCPLPPRIDTIQLEFGVGLRTASAGSDDAVLMKTAKAVAEAFCSAWKNYHLEDFTACPE